MTFKKMQKNLDAYDKDMNLIGNFDGEHIVSIKDGSLMPFRIDNDEIYTIDPQKNAELIGTFEGGRAILLNGELLFQCDE